MKICPNCRAEYEDGFDFCKKCTSPLVDKDEFLSKDAVDVFDATNVFSAVRLSLRKKMSWAL